MCELVDERRRKVSSLCWAQTRTCYRWTTCDLTKEHNLEEHVELLFRYCLVYLPIFGASSYLLTSCASICTLTCKCRISNKILKISHLPVSSGGLRHSPSKNGHVSLTKTHERVFSLYLRNLSYQNLHAAGVSKYAHAWNLTSVTMMNLCSLFQTWLLILQVSLNLNE